MTQTTHPTKQLVRDYMDERTRSDDPPPAPAEIRRQLGWDLLPRRCLPNGEQVADDESGDVMR